MKRSEFMALAVTAYLLSGCSDVPEPEGTPSTLVQRWSRCSPDSTFSNGITVDYPMVSDTTFTIVARSEAGQQCGFDHVFPCGIPGVAIPRLVVRDSSWIFFENGSGNYTRTLTAMSLDDCAMKYKANELLSIDTDHDLIALFDRAASPDKPTAVRLVSYANQEKGRIPLPGMLCAEHMACLDSAWFTLSSLRVSYRKDPNGPSTVAELSLPSSRSGVR
jgi:hypothetical protein